jgi:hypothetical protein
VVEDDYTTTFVADSKMLTFTIERDCRKGVSVGCIFCVPFTETVDVNPSDWLVARV